MKFSNLVPEAEIIRELAKRLARLRKAQGFTQAELAKQAGIGVATLRRIEGGRDSQLETWLKILKVLDRMSALDALLPESFNSPMAEALAGKSRKRKKPSPSSAVVWGDEAR